MKKPNDYLQRHVGELEADSRTRLRVLGRDGEATRPADAEFPAGADELVISGAASRRKFMGILGASTALAGLSSGCLRKPAENILPYAKRPEDIIPGNALFYATALQFGSTVQGLVVETHEGRPTKVEGNPAHPSNQGKTDVYAQAAVLSLYDVDRSRSPWSRVHQAQIVVKGKATDDEAKKLVSNKLCDDLYKHTLEVTKSADRARTLRDQCRAATKTANYAVTEQKVDGKKTGKKVASITLRNDVQSETSWELAWHQLDERFAKSGWGKTAFVVRDSMSPSFIAGVRALSARGASVYIDDPTANTNSAAGAAMVAGKGARVQHSLKGAKVIAAFDSDFLGVEDDHIRLAAEWATGREARDPEQAKAMNRLYAIEPHLTGTGAMADERLGLRGADVGRALAYVAVKVHSNIGAAGAKMGGTAQDIQAVKVAANKLNPGADYWGKQGVAMLDALADDLVAATTAGVVMVGARQPAAVHALALYINAMLGSLSDNGLARVIVTNDRIGAVAKGGVAKLAKALDSGKFDTVVCIGTNPAYDAPGSLAMGELLSKVGTLIHAGSHRDETGQLATWHLPLAHELESWGDLETLDGVASIVQPMIEPLHGSISALELVARVLQPRTETKGLDVVQTFWAAPQAQWRQWLHTGVVGRRQQRGSAVPAAWGALAKALPKLPVPGKGIEFNFHLDTKTLDGTFSNNAWMQELPAPISKLVWDNGAHINLKDAKEMGLENGDRLAINIEGRTAAIPVWISPGQARGSISLTLGYGRKGVGAVSEGAGFDTYTLQGAKNPWFAYGQADRGAGNYALASTQDWGYLDPDGPNASALRAQLGDLDYPERPLYRSETVKGFEKDPDFSQKGDVMPPERLKSLWDSPELTGKHQWGMSIDLNSCTGCNTCVIACQAENNIPVVGKKEAANGREMHWIRLDRYYRDFGDQPKTDIIPVGCQHCETAPCENVCPVQATAHSPEGLNDMAYNRCIGTRYCANNCPYKVRRFNFFNFNLDTDPIEQMQKNPDVTVRFRGVIEKCSYCVQRIQGAKIEAHVEGKDIVEDGVIQTACEQACPTGAIVFGDISNEESRVSKAKKLSRDYTLLSDLLTLPRTSYLARVRNPNPKLGKAEG